MATVKIVCAFCMLIICSTIRICEAQMGMEEQDCKANLAATGQYVLVLKEERDRLEMEVSRLRYWKDILERKNQEIEAKLLSIGDKGGKK